MTPPPAISAAPHAVRKITTMPAEITTKIFADVLGKKKMDKTTRRAFQALRSVCSRWRATCFSTPKFWSALSVAAHKIEKEGVNASGYGQLMGQWFARSGPNVCLELDFLADEVKGMAFMSVDDRKEVVRFTLEYQSRWKHLCLHIEVPEFWGIFAKAPTDKWRLETLVLLEYHLQERTTAGLLIEDGKANPLNQITTLKKLVLRDTSMEVNPINSIANLAHSGLVDLQLTVNRVKLENLKLENCVHLVTLAIKVSPATSIRWPDQYPQHSISLPNLKSLTLDAEDLRVLSHLNCRALADFHLLTRVSPLRPGVLVLRRLKPKVLADFLGGATDLSRVIIEGGPVDDTVLAELLRCLSSCTSRSLTVLGVDRWPSTDEHISLDCCPDLHELRVGGQMGWISLGDTTGITRTKQFIQHINARLDREDNKLKRLVVQRLSFMVYFPADLLEALEAKGLNVTVMTTSFTL
ncbi:hypothetical protein BKA70DRAFT_862807 [Coprinopsis sp. MPI-PUGE-AT-0042]|nr:hypothetical protein BKA70DRAFT_360217 [Coprinopsis sp. MPI-PUGE-AT-0042]KAH6911801.1 hypothetical protein BKA70DRAFT_862807 [Coprinopsis sp. MPI-PUGE-AT-0042]